MLDSKVDSLIQDHSSQVVHPNRERNGGQGDTEKHNKGAKKPLSSPQKKKVITAFSQAVMNQWTVPLE